MNKITESQIEEFAIELLERQGYQYIYAFSFARNIDKVSLPLGETEEMVIQ